MSLAPLAVVLAAGIASGVTACAALVAPRRSRPLVWLAAGAEGLLVAGALVAAWAESPVADILGATILVGASASLGGYALAAALLPALAERSTAIPVAERGIDDGTVHIIVLADVEPPEYRPRDVSRILETYESGDVPLPPFVLRPLAYTAERSRYHRGGGSHAREAVRDIASALAARPEGEASGGIEIAFCSGGPTLAEVVARTAAGGGRRFIVVALTVAWTRAFDRALGEAHALEAPGTDLRIAVTDPLWASQDIAAAVAQRATAAFGEAALQDGVVLVSEGNPWQIDREDPKAAEQSMFFAQRVRAELIDTGLPAERIRQAWLNWEQPDVPEAVRHLAALGAAQIALVPVDFMVETLSTAVDLPAAADRATFETGIRIEVVASLGSNTALIRSLRRRVAQASQEFETPGREPSLSSPGTALD